MVALIWIALGGTLAFALLCGWFWWRTRDYDPFGGPVTSRIQERRDER